MSKYENFFGELPRKLDTIERFFFTLDSIQRQNFILHARLSRVVDEFDVRRAFDKLLDMHAPLRTALDFGADGEPQIVFRAVRGDNLCLVGPDWKYLRNHALSLDLRGTPGVRCLLVGSGGRIQTVALAFHHSLFDGRSAVVLMGDLLRIATGQLPLHEPQSLTQAINVEVAPKGVEAALCQWMQDAESLASSWRIKDEYPEAFMLRPQIQRIKQTPTAYCVARQSAEAIGVSSHSWLAAQAVAAMHETIGRSSTKLALSHAVDLRRYEQHAPLLGCRAGLLLGSYLISAGDSEVAIAMQVHRKIQNGIACAFPIWLLNVMPWLNLPLDFGARIDAARADVLSAPSYLVISDLGSIDNEWRGIVDMVSQVGLTVQPLPGQLAVLTRVDLSGRSHLQLHTRPSIGSDVFMQRFATRIECRLNAQSVVPDIDSSLCMETV